MIVPANPLIRQIHAPEIPAVSKLTVDAYTSSYEIETGGSYYVQLGQVAERAQAHQVWVALDADSGELLGTVTTPLPGARLSAYAGPRDMDFRLLATTPSARGRGVGSALVAHCAALARERGAERLMLHTGDDMDLAIALYERLGFVRVPEIEADFPYPPGVWYPVRVYAMSLAQPRPDRA